MARRSGLRLSTVGLASAAAVGLLIALSLILMNSLLVEPGHGDGARFRGEILSVQSGPFTGPGSPYAFALQVRFTVTLVAGPPSRAACTVDVIGARSKTVDVGLISLGEARTARVTLSVSSPNNGGGYLRSHQPIPCWAVTSR